MVKKFMKICLIILIIITFGCSYSFRTNQYPDLETLRIEPFENKSTESNLEVEVFDSMIEQYSDDGRLNIVNQSPDILLQGSVLGYNEEIHSSDSANNVEEYIIKMSFSIKMTDMKNNQVLYDEKNLRVSQIYSVNGAETGAEYDNYDDAKNGIYEDLFEKIMQNTLEDW